MIFIKYIIVNGNQYIHISDNDEEYTTVDSFHQASHFTNDAAMDFYKNRLLLDSEWDVRKINKLFLNQDSRDYVITNMTLCVTNTCSSGITGNFRKAKWFRSIADAETYINKHKNIFENPVILDEDMNPVEMSARKTFTQEQLFLLGKCDNEKTKRIPISKTRRDIVYEEGHGICAICGKPVEYNHFTIDHIVPVSRGGNNEISNLQIACEDCNKLKGNRMNREFTVGLSTILSHSLLTNPDKDLSDMIIRAVVRGQLDQMFAGTCYHSV